MPEAAQDSLRAFMARGVTLDEVLFLADQARVKTIHSYTWFLSRFDQILRDLEAESGLLRLDDGDPEVRLERHTEWSRSHGPGSGDGEAEGRVHR